MKEPLVSRILARLAKRAGVKVNLEPEWKFAGQVVLPSGRKMYFRNTNLDLNPLGASEIARDKDYANYFMSKMGYPTVPGRVFFSDHWSKAISSKRNLSAAWRYARKLGLPVIVKPNSRSQGVGVSKVFTKREFYQAARFIFQKDNIMLVERALVGQDYRIVVLDKEVISAYERLPLTVIGNGRDTISKLLVSLQRKFIRTDRDTIIDHNDFRIKTKLRREHLRLNSVPTKGQKVVLLDNANLSAGGEALDVTERIHPGFRKFAVRLTRDMGLRYCGVDLMLSGEISKPPWKFWVLEVNAAPGLDHYATIGATQAKVVDGLYLKVLLAMRRSRR